MEEEIKQTLKQSIAGAFDRWGNQYYKKRIAKEGRLTKKLLEEARLEDLFLSKRIFILGFNRYVTKQALTNDDMRKQKSMILRAILQSIILERGITVKELEKNSESNDLYSRRHTQRIIHEMYSGVFVGLDNKHKDERLSPLSTVFSPHVELENDPLPQKLLETLNTIPMTKKNIEWMNINARIRSLTPEYLEELIQVRDEAIQIMREIGNNTETGFVLFQELEKVSEIQQIFHNHLQSIIAVSWWRSRRDTTKRKLIDDGFPWKYKEKEAIQARQLLDELTGSSNHTFKVMIDGGVALIETKLHDTAEIIFREALKNEEGPILWKGIAHENLGVYHRERKEPKLMVQEMKKAVEWYRKSYDNYRLSVGLKNLGEAEWKLGYKDAAKRYYDESEMYANSLDRKEKANALGNLAVSAQRIKNRTKEIEYLSMYIQACPEDWTERILNADKRLSEIT